MNINMKQLLTTKDIREIQMFLDNFREALVNKSDKLREKDNPNETLISRYDKNIDLIAQAQELLNEVDMKI